MKRGRLWMSAQWRWCSESLSQSYIPSPLKNTVDDMIKNQSHDFVWMVQKVTLTQAADTESFGTGSIFSSSHWGTFLSVCRSVIKNWYLKCKIIHNFIICTHLVKHVPFLVLPVHGSFCKSCKVNVRKNLEKYISGCGLLTEKRTIWKVLNIFPSLLPSPEFSSMLRP